MEKESSSITVASASASASASGGVESSLIRSPPDTPPSATTATNATAATTTTTASYPAYLSMYSSSKGSSFDPIAAAAVRNMESEKLRKIRRRKELKEYRKYTKVIQYRTLGDDKNYNLAAVLESLESSQNMASNNTNSSSNSSSSNNNNNNNGSNHNNNNNHASNSNNSVCNSSNSSSSSNGGSNKDSNNKKDKRGRRPITRRRSNQGGNNNGNNTSVKRSNSTSNEAASSSSEELEEEEEDKMSSSSLVGRGTLEDEDPLFSKPNKLERGLMSKSSENLSHYSSDNNLSSFTKVTNKKQKWKKKNAHSVEMPDHFNINNNNSSNNNGHIIAKGGSRPGSATTNTTTTTSLYNGYNLRNREVERPDIDLNAGDFPPLDSRVEEITPPHNCSNSSWSKHHAAPLSSVSSSSSSSVMNERDDESQQQMMGDLPDVTVREPPPLNSNATTRNHLLPDLAAQAVEAVRSSGETPSPPQEKSGATACEDSTFVRKVGDIAIALTEEEYRRQDPSIPVVIFGRSSSAIRDWTSKSDNFEFGFEVNESLLAMSSLSSSTSTSPSSHPPQHHQIRSPPVAENEEVLPLDRIDRAILSFGDSVTNLTVLGDETTSAESPQPDDSIHVPPYVEEEPITFNYNEVINYLESAWLESLKDKQPQCHPVASSAY